MKTICMLSLMMFISIFTISCNKKKDWTCNCSVTESYPFIPVEVYTVNESIIDEKKDDAEDQCRQIEFSLTDEYESAECSLK